jgi:hypothetical protein
MGREGFPDRANLSISQRLCHSAALAKSISSIPDVLPVSPLALACPRCGAKSGEDCATTSGLFSAVHLARIKAAALSNKSSTKKRK